MGLRLLYGFAFLLLLGPAASAAAEPESALEDLMRGMATTSGVVAHFRETKEIALLAAPLESRGVLYFIPPDRMARHTQSPGRASLIVQGERLRFADEAGDREMDLGSNPAAGIFVDNFMVLFGGDLARLRERYETEFHEPDASADSHWSLRLVPRHAPLRDFVASITLRGKQRALLEMDLLEQDGDRTRTHFERVEVDRAFSEEELRRFFSPRLGAAAETGP